jgi:hypothetical protein
MVFGEKVQAEKSDMKYSRFPEPTTYFNVYGNYDLQCTCEQTELNGTLFRWPRLSAKILRRTGILVLIRI